MRAQPKVVDGHWSLPVETCGVKQSERNREVVNYMKELLRDQEVVTLRIKEIDKPVEDRLQGIKRKKLVQKAVQPAH